MKETVVHGGVIQNAQCAPIGIGQDGLRSKLAADSSEVFVNFIECCRPGDTLEIAGIAAASALGHILFAAHGIQHALGGVYPVKIFGDFAAKKSPGNRVRGIALYFDSAAGISPFGLYRDQNPTGIRTIVRTCGIYLLLHSVPAML